MLHSRRRSEGFSAMKALARALATGKKEPVKIEIQRHCQPHYDHNRHTIVVPFHIKRNMSEDLWLLASATFDHEIAESETRQACDVIRDRYGANTPKELFDLANGIGDGLIVNQWQGQRFPGSGLVLDKFWAESMERDIADQYERAEDTKGVKHLLACIGSYIGNGTTTFDDAVASFPVVKDLLLQAEDWFRKIEDLADHPDPESIADEAADIAEGIYGELQYRNPPVPADGDCDEGDEGGESAENDDGAESDSSQSSENNQESDGINATEGEDEDSGAGGNGDGASEEQPSEDGADSSEDASEEEQDGMDEDSSSGGDSSSEEEQTSSEEESHSEPSDGTEDEGDTEGEGDTSGDDAEGDTGQQPTASSDAEGDGSADADPEPIFAEDSGGMDSVDDMLRKELERMFSEAENDAWDGDPQSTYVTYHDPQETLWHEFSDDELASQDEVEALRQDFTRYGSTLADRIRQVFVVPGPSVTEGERFGTLDEANLTRLVTREYTAFKQTTAQERQDAAVALAVDESGSMSAGIDGRPGFQIRNAVDMGEEAPGDTLRLTDVARQLTLTWAEAMARLDVPLEIVGFGSGPTGLRVLKHFDDDFDDPAVKRKVAAVQAGGGTPMADAVEVAGEALANRPEKLKILFVVTDGWPGGGDAYMNPAREACDEAGIVVVNLGVNMSHPGEDEDYDGDAKWADPWIEVTNPQDLALRASKELVDTIIRNS